MKLTREERSALFRARDGEGEWPKLKRPASSGSPCEAGAKISLSSLFWLEVTGVRRSRHGDFVVVYEAQRIEQPRYLAPAGRRVPVDDRGQPKPMTADEAQGYTGNPKAAIERGVPSVGRDDQRVITMDAHRKAEGRQGQERLRREQHTLETRLGIARKVAAVKGVDIAVHERAIERRLLELERLLDGRADRAA